MQPLPGTTAAARSTTDRASLQWVRADVEASLDRARAELEAFAGSPAQTERMLACAEHLHEVRGVLEMLEVYGVSLLLDELDQLARSLHAGRVARREDACEVLMQGIVQAPLYLDFLLRGHRDNPVVLMPLLNDLRSVRGLGLLSENALFAPDLEAPLPLPSRGPALRGDALAAHLRKLRPRLQQALLAWFRGDQAEHSLQVIESVVTHLQKLLGNAPAARIWWVARAVVDALRAGGLDPSPSVKRLVGRLDAELRELLRDPDTALERSAPPEVLKNLLYYCARARGGGKWLGAVRSAFTLHELLADPAQHRRWPAELFGPDLQTVGTVAGALQDILARVEDGLDEFNRSAEPRVADLAALDGMLQQVADTLGLLGEGAPRRTVIEQQRVLAAHVASGQAPAQERLMDVAAALLRVEAAIEVFARQGAGGGAGGDTLGEEAPDEALRVPDAPPAPAGSVEGTQDALLGGVIGEAKAELALIKDTISTYVQEPAAHERIGSIAGRIQRVAGGMRMLDLDTAAALFERWMEHADRTLLQGAGVPPPLALESLADGIESLDYYLESLTAAGTEAPLRLARAAACIAALDTSAHDTREAGASPRREPDMSAYDTVVMDAPVWSSLESAVDAPSGPAVPPDLGYDTFAMPSVSMDGRPLGEPPEPATPESPAPAPPTPRAGEAATPRGDDEMYLRFSPLGAPAAPGAGAVLDEDAAAPPDEAAGDDDTLPPGAIPDALARSLLQARDLLDRLEAAHERAGPDDGARPEQDDEGPEEPPLRMPERLDAEALLGAGVDADILEVFVEEAAQVLRGLQDAMPAWLARPADLDALGEIRRAFHTLKGSGRMVGAAALGEVCWSVENLLNRVMDGIVPPAGDIRALVGEAISALPALLGELRGGAPARVDVQSIAVRAERLAEAGASAVAGPRAPLRDTATEAGGAAHASDGAEILDFPLRRETPAQSAGLVAVLREEAGQHARVLRELLRAGEATAQPYLRPLHTLAGAGRTAGWTQLAALCAAAEHLVTTLVLTGTALAEPVRAYLGEVVEQVESAIRPGGPSPPQLAEPDPLVARAMSLASSLGGGATLTGQAGEAALAERLELREAFLEEAADILDLVESVMERWRADGAAAPRLLGELQRGLHTLKGGARMAQYAPIADLGHALEAVTALAADGRIEAGPALLDVVVASHDLLADMLDCVVAHQLLEPPTALIARIAAMAPGTPLPVLDDDEHAAGVLASPLAPAPGVATEPARAEVALLPGARGDRLTVDAAVIDALAGHAGEIAIAQSRVEQQLGAVRQNLEEMGQTVRRLREQLRELEIETESQIRYRHERETGRDPEQTQFDPLELDRFSRMQELSRGLAESVGDLGSIQGMLSGLTRETEGILITQARSGAELQDRLLRARMLPVARLLPRFRRVLRQTARDLGKQVRLEASGEDIRIDRAILARIVGALEHLLRNSADHGIELPDERLAAGKRAEGQVRLDVRRDGNEVVLEVSDDGAGVRLDAVRRRAVERGLLGADTPASADALLPLVFEPGLSTRESVSQISGRGVGLDVVRSEVRALGGSVRVTSEPERGARFVLRVPLTLTVNQALMVGVAGEQLGLPLNAVESVLRIEAARARALEGMAEPYFEHGGVRYPLRYLGGVLGIGEPDYGRERYPVVLMRAGDQRIALRVDELRGRSEVVVKSVGPLLAAIGWIAGATILGDGCVVLVVDAPVLLQMAAARPAPLAPDADAGEERGPVVMVVDDSITVRKVTGRFLARNGMRVTTARDGLEALGMLQEQIPDLMLLDIEMPRMDGFELATAVRNDARTRELPIIIITSRSGQKHSDRAAQIGVSDYLGKPYHEAELLRRIRRVLGTARAGQGPR